MPVKIESPVAVEKSTYVVTASFTDEDGNAVAPNAGLQWTLTDRAGNVINGRSAVEITPGTSVDIVLSGDDLVIADSGLKTRHLLIEGTYDSTAGSGLPLKEEVIFYVEDLLKVT